MRNRGGPLGARAVRGRTAALFIEYLLGIFVFRSICNA